MGTGGRGKTAATARAGQVVAGAAGIVLITLVASTFGSPIAGTPTRDFEAPTKTLSSSTSSGPTLGDGGGRSLPPSESVASAPSWLSAIVALIFVALCAMAGYFALRWVRETARARRTDPERPPAPIPPEAAVAALLEDTARHRDALDDGIASEAIIAMWVTLEQSVARAGITRHPSETSAELTVRVLERLDFDGEGVMVLAALYREARFSRHHVTDAHRERARAALRQVHLSLSQHRASGSNGGDHP
ncbi:DUF4129 domain-containing protein [Demetria terragena]|uniref:DUF4129 domain-containing protein n=1 Tax=Demetria terragena TaxID=63959 RepID=UPI000370998D|nr:DUF4129 domain-containing protein [Demetria terragena]